MSASVSPLLITANEFIHQVASGNAAELVRGRIVESPMPDLRHGFICSNISGILRAFVKAHQLGRVMSNDSFVRTQSDPDTVRGGDVCYIRYSLLPPGPVPEGLLEVVPELIVEVRSPSDRWIRLVAKAAEYIEAGVRVVMIVDPGDQTCSLYRSEEKSQTLAADDELTIPELLPGFVVLVHQFFE
jgi:Uma2 family endonuclease